jgi:hypothetical protein
MSMSVSNEFRDIWIRLTSWSGGEEERKLCLLMPKQFPLTTEEKNAKHVDYTTVATRGLSNLKRDDRRDEFCILCQILIQWMHMAPQYERNDTNFERLLVEKYLELDALFFQSADGKMFWTRDFKFTCGGYLELESNVYRFVTVYSDDHPIRHQTIETDPGTTLVTISTVDGMMRQKQQSFSNDKIVICGVESLIHLRYRRHYFAIQHILPPDFAHSLWSIVVNFCALPVALPSALPIALPIASSVASLGIA